MCIRENARILQDIFGEREEVRHSSTGLCPRLISDVQSLHHRLSLQEFGHVLAPVLIEILAGHRYRLVARAVQPHLLAFPARGVENVHVWPTMRVVVAPGGFPLSLSLIHISEPTRPSSIS